MSEIMKIAIIFLSGNLVGVMVGWASHSLISKKENDLHLKPLVAFVVMFIWAISSLYAIVSTDYETPLAVHGLFGTVVGFFYEGVVERTLGKRK